MEKIPMEYLIKMGTYNFTIDGVTVTAYTADIPAVVEKHLTDLQHCVRKHDPKVVGIDIIHVKDTSMGTYSISNNNLLVLSYAPNHCLIIHLDCSTGLKLPDSLVKFLTDPTICFFGVSSIYPSHYYSKQVNKYNKTRITNISLGCSSIHQFQLGELAARALMKPGLTGMSLADVAREVGVAYEAPSSKVIEAHWRNTKVLTGEQVKLALTNAYAYYQVGHKLLSNINTNY